MSSQANLIGAKMPPIQAKMLGYITNAGSPVSSVTPQFRGQECFDTTNSIWYKATGTTNTDWAQAGNPALSATELAYLDTVVAGTATASKAVVLGASKDIATITTATITTLNNTTLNSTNIDAGASGTAGTVDVFPATAASGKLAITCADQTGDTTVTLTTAAMAAARTVTIPDPGAAASFVMTEGAQTVNGAKSFTAPIVKDHNTGITAFATGGQASATALTGEWNNVTTCATDGDSVKLLTAVAGQVQTVKNSGAASLAVFPNTSDAINALAADLSINIPVGGEVTFRAIDGTTWETIETISLTAPTTQKGELVIRAADSAGDTATLITNASQSGARTYTIPDAGADCFIPGHPNDDDC